MRVVYVISFLLFPLLNSVVFAQQRVSENYDPAVPPDAVVTGAPSQTHFGTLPLQSFEETDFPPAGWKKITHLGGTGWQRGTIGTRVPGFSRTTEINAPSGGDSAVAVVTWSTGDADKDLNTPQATDQWLITPQITDVDSSDILVFHLRYFTEFTDTLDVLISTTGDTTTDFTTPVDVLAFSGPGNNDWIRYEYRLTDFVPEGSDIYIAFHEHVANTLEQGDAFFLDLVEVSDLVTHIRSEAELPAGVVLHQNYPNPFNPATRISFAIPQDSHITLRIINLAGQTVRVPVDDAFYRAGEYSISISGEGLPSGVYYYVLQAEKSSVTRKMMLVK